MAITTIYQSPELKKSKYGYYGLLVLGLIALGYFLISFAKDVSLFGKKSSLSVENLYAQAEVFVDEKSQGTTPVQSKEVKSGIHELKLKSDKAEYKVSLNFSPNTEVVVKRDLGVSSIFSGGINFWVEKTAKASSKPSVSVVSEPAGADIFIDGTRVGKTPYSSSDLTPGDYDFRLELAGYESQAARIEVTEGHNLNISAALFPKPVPDRVSLVADSKVLYDVFSDNSQVTSDPQLWARALGYWNQTRGINLEGVGVNKEKVFDFYIDYNGVLYSSDGVTVQLMDDPKLMSFAYSATFKGAYLRRLSDGAPLTAAAKKTFETFTNTAVGTVKKAKILTTGLGWLRVRDAASLDGSEISKVNVGDQFDVLEEKPGWVKIKVSETISGWVSATYVEVSN